MSKIEVLGMTQQCLPEGTRLTRGAQVLIRQAEQVGVPPGRILQVVVSAARSAQEERRTKVGPFGGAQPVFEGLRLEALQRRRDLLFQELLRKPK